MSKRGKARDFTMARLGAAVVQLEEAKDMAVSALQEFVEPEDDASGADRVEGLQAAAMATNGALLSLQEAIDGLQHMSEAELAMPEPHYEAEEEDESAEDDAEDAEAE
jgi:hypothetical protein